MSETRKKLDLAAVRARLEGARGRDYWRSLDDLAATPEFQELLAREFPQQAIGWSDDEDRVEGRRNFLKLMGASLALAGLSACTRQPTEHIMPYVRQPEEIIPGRPLFFATAATLNGVASGLLAESHEGRPTKLEGNPEHPATLGACDPFSQASVLQLYDPDRSQAVTYNGEIRSWADFLGSMREIGAAQRIANGAGIRVLTETITSPTMAEQFRTIQKLLPAAKWHQWDPAGPHSARAAAVQTFGQPVNTWYNLANAKVVVSLDSDFLASGPAFLRYAREFAARRRVRGNQTEMNRLYVVEPTPTATGSKADHRLPLRAADIEEFAWALATSLGAANGPKQGDNGDIYKWLGPIARDLQLNKGAGLVIAGGEQPPIVHALAHVMNASLGNVGKTVFYSDPIEANPVDQVASLGDLVKDLEAGRVDLLLILGGNPAFDAPVEWGMRDQIAKARIRVHLSLYDNETSELCQWHLPAAHYLEAWGDARAFDGTVTIQQPLIQPLYNGRSAIEILQMLTDQPERRASISSRPTGRRSTPAPISKPGGANPCAMAWCREQPSSPALRPSAAPPSLPRPRSSASPESSKSSSGPIPLSTTAASPTMAGCRSFQAHHQAHLGQRLHPQPRRRPSLQRRYRRSRNPHLSGPLPARAPYGCNPARSTARLPCTSAMDAPAAAASPTAWASTPTAFAPPQPCGMITASNSKRPPAPTSSPPPRTSASSTPAATSSTRAISRSTAKIPNPFTRAPKPAPPASPSIREWKYEGHAWGMAIDLNACAGCSACVVACVAEDDVAVVGKDQVRRGRAMHWIRVDTYSTGDVQQSGHVQPGGPLYAVRRRPLRAVCPRAGHQPQRRGPRRSWSVAGCVGPVSAPMTPV